ncbi:MAG: hypothetical protein PHG94_10780, partial [Syntrophomonas sp.]|uniref:hypothetical protein n=1 Tax=Syntrophomonas sp. TaxID=2053627 RepID=UPI0026091624
SEGADQMTDELWRYYYFLEDDAGNFTPLKEVLQKNKVNYYPDYSIKLLKEEKSFSYQLKQDNLSILVLCCLVEKDDWADCLASLEAWEEEAGINPADIIAQTSVFLSTKMAWDEFLLYTQKLSQQKEALDIGIEQGQMARLCRLWPQGKAFYACHLDNYTRQNRNFLGSELPLLEARLLRLRMISSFLREQKNTVLREREQLDQELSAILHTQLVMEKGSAEEAMELEKQVEGLSRAYGKIAGDYNTLLSAANRLSSLLQSFRQQPGSLDGADLSEGFISDMISPYLRCLREIEDAQNNVMVSRENHQAAIEVVRSKIDIMNARSNIATQEEIRNLMQLNVTIQKQSLVFQYAAGLIEFIVLAYYSHSLWSHLAPGAYGAIPGWIQFLVVIAFSGNTVYCTHLMAEYMQGDHHVKNKLIASAILLFLILLIVIAASALLSTPLPH